MNLISSLVAEDCHYKADIRRRLQSLCDPAISAKVSVAEEDGVSSL
jgi:hypothetical protein